VNSFQYHIISEAIQSKFWKLFGLNLEAITVLQHNEIAYALLVKTYKV